MFLHRFFVLMKKIREIVALDGNHPFSTTFDKLITYSVLLAIIHLTLETELVIYEKYKTAFLWTERLLTVIFTVEYVLRIISFKRSYYGKSFLRYLLSFDLLIDFFALLPFYLTLLPIDLRYLRTFRLLRLARIFKLTRYNKAINTVKAVISSKKEILTISFILIGLILYMVSAVMYYVEYETQPEVFSSIPKTLWWGVATLTTVGYGDIYPVTALGRTLGGVIAILGIGIFAIPTGIIAAGFTEYVEKGEVQKD
jgi:voltage-gated potassium channel